MTRVVVTLAIVLAGAGACGRKTRVMPPEEVRPTAPANLLAKATSDGVLLSWGRPTTYTGGLRMRDLASFVVERAVDHGGTLAYAPAATVELQDRQRFQQAKRLEWTDADVKEGERYFYRVIAVTADDDRSAPGGPISIDYHRPPPAPAKPEPKAPAAAPPAR